MQTGALRGGTDRATGQVAIPAVEHQGDNPFIVGAAITAFVIALFVGRERWVQSWPVLGRHRREDDLLGMLAMAWAIFGLGVVFVVGCVLMVAGLTGHY